MFWTSFRAGASVTLPMRTPCLALLWTLILCLPAVAEEARLTVLHTTDLHGALTAHDYLTDRPAALRPGQAGFDGAGDPCRGCSHVAPRRRRLHPGRPARDRLSSGGPHAPRADDDRDEPDRLRRVGGRQSRVQLRAGGARASARRPRASRGSPPTSPRSDGQPAFDASVVKTPGRVRVGVVGICTPAVPWLEDSVEHRGLPLPPAGRGRAPRGPAPARDRTLRCGGAPRSHRPRDADGCPPVRARPCRPTRTGVAASPPRCTGVDRRDLGALACRASLGRDRRGPGGAGRPLGPASRPRRFHARSLDFHRALEVVSRRSRRARRGGFDACGFGARLVRRALSPRRPEGARRARSARRRATSRPRAGDWRRARYGSWSIARSSRPPAPTSPWPRSSTPRLGSRAAR